jgi:streptogramin lyase
VAVGDGAVWVTSAGALDLGPTSAGGIPNSVAAGNGAVWVGGITKGSIARLEPA